MESGAKLELAAFSSLINPLKFDPTFTLLRVLRNIFRSVKNRTLKLEEKALPIKLPGQ